MRKYLGKVFTVTRSLELGSRERRQKASTQTRQRPTEK